MSSSIPFDDLAQYLLSRAADLVPRWLPGGHLEGREYCCADITGGPGKSMKVNMDTGRWKDFAATNLEGHDLVSLFAAQQGLRNGEAALRLMKETGYEAVNPTAARSLASSTPTPAQSDGRGLKPPKDVPRPNFGGRTTDICAYKDFDGELICYIARWDPPGKKKIVVPFTWDGQTWVKKAYPAPRPLLQLDQLAAKPKAPVLIVEGELKAKKAQQLVGDRYVVTTWMGGSAAEAKSDFKVLRGREVLLWPDCDADKRYPDSHPTMAGQRLPYSEQPGPAVMDRIGTKLAAICQEVKVLDLRDMYDLFGQEGGVKDAWDAADAVAEGWGWERFFDWAAKRVVIIPAPALAKLDQESKPVPTSKEADKRLEALLTTTPDAGLVPKDVEGLWTLAGIVRLSNKHALCNVDNVTRLMDVAPEFHEAPEGKPGLINLNERPKGRPLIWWDYFHQKVFTTWNPNGEKPTEPREWSDVDTLNLLVRFQRQFGFRRLGDDTLYKAVLQWANRTRRSEPHDWMEKLKWDKEERVLPFWERYFDVKLDEYTGCMAMNFWIAMVARIYEPACQSDHMVVLHGPEGVGKSTALSIIGGRWYTAMMLDLQRVQSFLEVLPGKLIVEISEMDAFRKADGNTIKKITSNREDRYRPSYGRMAVDFKRQCFFVGTTNENDILGGTGSVDRRFWPITVEVARLEDLRKDREQLFAEAVHYFKQGRHWHLMPESVADERDKHREVDQWEEEIRNHLVNKNECTLSDIFANALGVPVNRRDAAVTKRVTKLLRKIGFRPVQIWDERDKTMVRRWVRQAQADLLGE